MSLAVSLMAFSGDTPTNCGSRPTCVDVHMCRDSIGMDEYKDKSRVCVCVGVFIAT